MKIKILSTLLGWVFLVSSISKAVNIPAFEYEILKWIEAYFKFIGFAWAFRIAIAVCLIEFILAMSLIIKKQIKTSSLCCCVLLAAFTGLTGMNYFFPPNAGSIESCGCFGEFIHLNPLTSFMKSITLFCLAIVLTLNVHSKAKGIK